MVVVFHVDTEADELDAFGLETHALFESVLAGEEDFSAGADDALPRDAAGTGSVEGPRSLAGCAGKSCGVGNVAVGGDLAERDAADLGKDLLEHVGLGHGNRF